MTNAPSANQAAKKSYVMLHRDNKDNLASLDGNKRKTVPDSVAV
jgi:hypothetical protein